MSGAAAVTDSLGRYRLVVTLATGGMGTVHLAVAGDSPAVPSLFVIKELRPELARTPKFVSMFLEEARLAARLNHPNVVQTIEAGCQGDRYFLAMEFLDGQPLSAFLTRARKVGDIGLPVRVQIVCEALAGLHYAHELCDYSGQPLGIVHRDVSPQNVFVTYNGGVKLLDFGVAIAAGGAGATESGVFKGKLSYAAPEHAQGRPLDRRSDVFAMGILLWEAVTLRRFARGPASRESVDARIHGREPRLAEITPAVDPRLAEICDRALAVDPDARFATAEAFRHALQEYLWSIEEAPSAPEIGRTIREHFAAERAQKHAWLDTMLKEREATDCGVRLGKPAPAQQSSDRAAMAAISQAGPERAEAPRLSLPSPAARGTENSQAGPERVEAPRLSLPSPAARGNAISLARPAPAPMPRVPLVPPKPAGTLVPPMPLSRATKLAPTPSRTRGSSRWQWLWLAAGVLAGVTLAVTFGPAPSAREPVRLPASLVTVAVRTPQPLAASTQREQVGQSAEAAPTAAASLEAAPAAPEPEARPKLRKRTGDRPAAFGSNLRRAAPRRRHTIDTEYPEL